MSAAEEETPSKIRHQEYQDEETIFERSLHLPTIFTIDVDPEGEKKR
jgi:hypothetical protein